MAYEMLASILTSILLMEDPRTTILIYNDRTVDMMTDLLCQSDFNQFIWIVKNHNRNTNSTFFEYIENQNLFFIFLFYSVDEMDTIDIYINEKFVQPKYKNLIIFQNDQTSENEVELVNVKLWQKSLVNSVILTIDYQGIIKGFTFNPFEEEFLILIFNATPSAIPQYKHDIAAATTFFPNKIKNLNGWDLAAVIGLDLGRIYLTKNDNDEIGVGGAEVYALETIVHLMNGRLHFHVQVMSRVEQINLTESYVNILERFVRIRGDNSGRNGMRMKYVNNVTEFT